MDWVKWPVQIGTGCQRKGDGLESDDGPRVSLSSQTSSLRAVVRAMPGGARCSETAGLACRIVRGSQVCDRCIRSV